jgi:ATP/maltotriose-dependent transcriptional regulator MalT
MRCDFGAAGSRLEASLALLKQLGLPPNVEIVLGELGLLALATGDLGLARVRLEEALTIARSIGDRYGQSGFASNLSEVAHARGDNETALALARQGLTIADADGNASLRAIALVAEGDALQALGQLDEAEAGYRSAGAVYAAQRRTLPGLGPQAGLVEVALRRGGPAEARARAEEILGVLAADAATAACAPSAVYWACWQALRADRDPRAGALLTQAQRWRFRRRRPRALARTPRFMVLCRVRRRSARRTPGRSNSVNSPCSALICVRPVVIVLHGSQLSRATPVAGFCG